MGEDSNRAKKLVKNRTKGIKKKYLSESPIAIASTNLLARRQVLLGWETGNCEAECLGNDSSHESSNKASEARDGEVLGTIVLRSTSSRRSGRSRSARGGSTKKR